MKWKEFFRPTRAKLIIYAVILFSYLCFMADPDSYGFAFGFLFLISYLPLDVLIRIVLEKFHSLDLFYVPIAYSYFFAAITALAWKRYSWKFIVLMPVFCVLLFLFRYSQFFCNSAGDIKSFGITLNDGRCGEHILEEWAEEEYYSKQKNKNKSEGSP